MYESTRSHGFGDEVKRRVMLGTYALSSGYYDAYYGQAQRVRTKIAQDFAAAFENFDLLLMPTAPSVAFGLGEKTADPYAMYLSDYCTVPASLAGLPAISIPCGLATPPGGGGEMPVGLQIVAPAFAENRLLDAAHALEKAIAFDSSPAAAR
jgi:aspartyl-tRNA(Asn)/glutamyl-tRNA(Gln) amidotransferase subunit A